MHYHRSVQKERRVQETSTPNSILTVLNSNSEEETHDVKPNGEINTSPNSSDTSSDPPEISVIAKAAS